MKEFYNKICFHCLLATVFLKTFHISKKTVYSVYNVKLDNLLMSTSSLLQCFQLLKTGMNLICANAHVKTLVLSISISFVVSMCLSKYSDGTIVLQCFIKIT